MVEREEVGEPAAAKPSAQAELLVLRREAERLAAEVRELRARQAAERGLDRSRSLEAVGRLAGGIAHDFDNLLTALVDSLESAKRAASSGAPCTGDLERAASAARDATRITKQLLAFAGVGVARGEVVDLALETQRSVEIIRRLVDGDVVLRVEASTEPVWVYLDRAHLAQILLHLVINARDAMPRGGSLAIEVRPLARTTKREGELRPGGLLRIADSGVGIPAADLPRIFDPFFTTKLPGRGAGLGLSTVFGVVEASRGEIDVESVEGRGTTFDVWLRAAPAPSSPGKRPRSVPRLDAVGVVAPPARETVLVVEDNASLAETCVAIFEGAGYRVLVARDGAAALSALEAEPDIRAILSDVVMPKLSGIELAKVLAVRFPQVRVVLWSGYPEEVSDEALRRSSGDRGMHPNVVSVLPKPVEADALLRAISQAASTR